MTDTSAPRVCATCARRHAPTLSECPYCRATRASLPVASTGESSTAEGAEGSDPKPNIARLAIIGTLVVALGLVAFGGARQWSSYVQARDLRHATTTPFLLLNTSGASSVDFFVDDLVAAENVGPFELKASGRERTGVGAARVRLYPGEHTIVARLPSGEEVGRVEVDVPMFGWRGGLYAPLHASKVCFALHVDAYSPDSLPAPREEIAMPADTDVWVVPRDVNNWLDDNPDFIKSRTPNTELTALRAVPCES